ncbi:hypothetical protein [Litorimonas sp.]|uniref:hypothetical protein n=1 Tax=Litorimonas sp. TaxID=1892381 RepID=UPI003A883521
MMPVTMPEEDEWFLIAAAENEEVASFNATLENDEENSFLLETVVAYDESLAEDSFLMEARCEPQETRSRLSANLVL